MRTNPYNLDSFALFYSGACFTGGTRYCSILRCNIECGLLYELPHSDGFKEHIQSVRRAEIKTIS